MMTAPLHWPCVIKLAGVDELCWVGDELLLRAELEGLIVSADDCLIDSLGNCFELKAVQLLMPRSSSANAPAIDNAVLDESALNESVLNKLELDKLELDKSAPAFLESDIHEPLPHQVSSAKAPPADAISTNAIPTNASSPKASSVPAVSASNATEVTLPVSAKLDADAMSMLLQKHFFSLGGTCVTKVQFSSVGAAIAALA